VKKWFILLILLIIIATPVCVFAGVPLDTVKSNVNGVLDVLRDPKLKGEAGKTLKEQRVEVPPTSSSTMWNFPKGPWG
jgi:hypothetical protein